MSNEGQEMETYQTFVFPMGNNKITQELWFQSPKGSLSPRQ